MFLKLPIKVELGKIYTGKVTRIVDFGAFVSIIGGKEGLVHVSQIADQLSFQLLVEKKDLYMFLKSLIIEWKKLQTT